MLLADSVAMPACLGLSLWLAASDPAIWTSVWLWPTCTAIGVYSFRFFGLYRSIVRFMGLELVVAGFKSVTIVTIFLVGLAALIGPLLGALKIGVVFWLAASVYLSGSRIVARIFLQADRVTGDRVIIYGAGNAGAQLVSAISRGGRFTPMAFVDDSPALSGTVINGLEVYSPDALPSLIESLGIARVLLALPSISRRRRHRIIHQLEAIPIHVQTMPDISDLISGSARVDEIREVDVADLLGRVAVPSVDGLLDASIRGKSVLVTGAGGSIGSELCRQIVRLEAKRLIMLDISEAALYTIDQKLQEMTRQESISTELVPLIGSAHHQDRMIDVMRTYGAQTVYHAAAYKHVPLVEHNMIEGVHNNVFGTLHTAEAAVESGVESFVLVSTDKAVLQIGRAS
ncbi:MAG: polysaccharide biosynthesis protein, partial [Candidatus Rariloculaceae bacterium]